MKLQKLLSFLLVCTAIFFIGCHGGNKPDYPEDDDTDTVSAAIAPRSLVN